MPELDDHDPPSFLNPVARRVTLDMLEDDELVDEMVRRKLLTVVTATRSVPRNVFTKPDFWSAMRAILSCDVAKQLVQFDLIGEDMDMVKSDLKFFAQIVVLNTMGHDNEERT